MKSFLPYLNEFFEYTVSIVFQRLLYYQVSNLKAIQVICDVDFYKTPQYPIVQFSDVLPDPK